VREKPRIFLGFFSVVFIFLFGPYTYISSVIKQKKHGKGRKKGSEANHSEGRKGFYGIGSSPSLWTR
jgi:hypothetical protein